MYKQVIIIPKKKKKLIAMQYIAINILIYNFL